MEGLPRFRRYGRLLRGADGLGGSAQSETSQDPDAHRACANSPWRIHDVSATHGGGGSVVGRAAFLFARLLLAFAQREPAGLRVLLGQLWLAGGGVNEYVVFERRYRNFPIHVGNGVLSPFCIVFGHDRQAARSEERRVAEE